MNVKGLIIRETDFGEYDRYITVLTEWNTKITVLCKGVRRRRSPFAAVLHLFSYTEFTLFENKGRYTLTEAQALDSFWGITSDILAYALCCYFSQLTESGLTEYRPEEDGEDRQPYLRLFLCALYSLTSQKRKPSLVKAAYEMRFMSMLGYTPDLSGCVVCGKEPAYFSVENGNCLCARCGSKTGYTVLGRGALAALRFMVSADLKNLFSYTVEEKTEQILVSVCQHYVLYHSERSFDTLHFYQQLLS